MPKNKVESRVVSSTSTAEATDLRTESKIFKKKPVTWLGLGLGLGKA